MEKVKLSDIIQETITGEWGTDIKKDENDVYVIRTADFCNDGTINYDKVEKRNIAEKKIKEKSLVIGDIIIEKSGGTDKNPVGRVVLFDKENYKCLANNFTQVLRVKNEYYYKYIFYQLFYKYKCGATLQMFNQTTGIQNLQMKIYLNQKLNTYIKEEQIEIANKLDKVQEIIDIRKKQIEELEQLIKSQFVEMFGDPILNNKNWGLYKWNDVLTIKNGKNQKKVEKQDGKYPIYGSGGIMSYATDYICNEDSVIIGRKGNINNPILVRTKFWNVDTAFGLEPNKDKLLVEYLYYFCDFYNFEKHNKAVTIPSLTKSDLLNIDIPIPDIELQNQFAEIVKQIDEQKFEIQKSLEEMQKLQESFMNKYFG